MKTYKEIRVLTERTQPKELLKILKAHPEYESMGSFDRYNAIQKDFPELSGMDARRLSADLRDFIDGPTPIPGWGNARVAGAGDVAPVGTLGGKRVKDKWRKRAKSQNK